MMHICAPGKLFLVGEYAVLDGAPALLSAVDRRVHVSVATSTDRHWHIHAPDIGVIELRLNSDGTLPDTVAADQRKRLRLYECVLSQACIHIGQPPEALSIRIDSGAFSRDGHKLGLGSSAAVASCLTAVLAQAAGQALAQDTLCRHAIDAHRQAQNGSGSGADVATSIYGGVIEFRADSVLAQPAWPAGIDGMAVVTGDGASTPQLVTTVRAYAQRKPRQYAADMGALVRLAEQAHDALADADAFLDLMRAYLAALQVLDRHATAGIVLPQHERLAALAARHGGVFKTTGAGGGDLGLAFARSGSDSLRLVSALHQAGAHIVPLQFAAPGLSAGQESAP